MYNFNENENNCFLSIVIPLYNEEDNVDVLIERILNELYQFDFKFEIILVDDGSKDKTWENISNISRSNPVVKGVKLARNFGHQHALLAGLSKSTGQAIISMDGDLQHPPSLIKKMVEKHREGFLVVNTFRKDEEVSSFFKRKSSSFFYKIFSFLTDVYISQGSSDFRLLDRVVLNELLVLKDVDLFLRGAVEWLGFPSVTIPYEADKRFSGISKYTLSKMIKFAKGSIISFSTKPLVIGIWVGIITSILSIFEVLYVIFQWVNGETVAGWASTVGIVSFLFGVLFILLGVIGAYLSRIHIALQNRPRFIISEISCKND